ncbi:MAG: Oxygen-independent coproporphyrinogen-III oxidase-like protein YqeR [Anaerolineales bacterium]|nr:Oxygen-independent coproporphyrinogen-III oxidase-like protein YqeR [Anaerolineales bacterium]
MTPDTSIYLHIPFCAHRCAYCDFNTYAGQGDSIPAYVDALIKEINFGAAARPSAHATIGTIFFGGGTPSLLSAPQLASIMDALRAAFTFSSNLEATIEANPGTTSPEFLHQIRAAGINRISFGVQSANPEELHMLERVHDFFDVIQSVKWARQAGLDNLNLDVIYGLPEQTLQTWQTSLQRILDLHPEHISAYALTLEHGTPFGRWSARGMLPLPDPDLAAEMYEWASETLEANGYKQYEISNWAKEVKGQKSKVRPSTFDLQPWAPAFACKHNLQYWRGLPYLAFGAGAHGYAGGYRYSNVLRIKTYIDRLTANSQQPGTAFPLTPAAVNYHRLSKREEMQEAMLTGLRLVREGVSDAAFRRRFGIGIEDAFPKEVDELLRLGLLAWNHVSTDSRLRLMWHARLVSNQVFVRFVE